ncbi:aquaporin family protein [Ruania suaedae]|uniref:MIP/aquaporin family protein n=1 Tax=Ruania suaedae TaxID=2897774 RepID=UPI001E3D1C62|nr:MIP/aquaporin family protein [Ruania suaedae]UFU04683.1 aquaporin family protein [Ruania suaedae]
MNFSAIFVPELFGTMMLTLLGCGVVANASLPGTKGNGGGFLMVNFGWGLAVFAGVFVAISSGAHINPAVTIGLIANGAEEFADGVPVSAANTLIYILAQMVGALLGAVFCWLAYKTHFDADSDGATKLGVFSTGPAIRSYGWNVVTEVIGTFVLVFVVISFGFAGEPATAIGSPLAVGLLVVGIGASLGGPTGYAINPARDLGPRIAHALLPIKGKGSSDWSYAWVPVVGPLIGGIIGGLAAAAIFV